MALFSLTGRTALITGASDGLGFEFAQMLAAAGARVVLAARRLEGLERCAELIRQNGGHALPIAMDVSKPASIAGAFEQMDTAGWRANVLINNAAVGLQKPWLDTTDDDWEHALNVNLLGANRVAKAVCSRLIAHGEPGTVVHIASVLGMTSQAVTTAYGASKAALIDLTKKMAVELARYRITVNCIAPGMFRTAIVADFVASDRGKAYLKTCLSRRIGEPSELAGTLLFLASPAAAYVNGVVIPVDGGNHLRGM